MRTRAQAHRTMLRAVVSAANPEGRGADVARNVVSDHSIRRLRTAVSSKLWRLAPH
jgi:hypothetical protein